MSEGCGGGFERSRRTAASWRHVGCCGGLRMYIGGSKCSWLVVCAGRCERV